MMKIAVMLRHIREAGGIVTFSRNLVEGFIRQGPEHHFALLYQSPEQAGLFGSHGNVTEHVAPAKNKFLWDQRVVPKKAAELDCDLIYNPKLSVPLFARVPVVLALRPEQFVHPELFKWADRQYFKFFMPRYCRAAARIIAPTRTAAADIVQYVGASPEKTLAIHEGAGEHFHQPPPDAPDLDLVRRRYGLPQRYVLFVGGITPLKNFERLVMAFGQVREKFDTTLVVVGFNRWSFEKDLAFAAQHPAAEHIHFTGFVEDADMPSVYRMAQALFFPSIYEGFGIPVVEAFCTGCPVVTSNRGCSPEVAQGAARLVDPFSVDDMAQGLAQVLGDPELARSLAEGGRSLAPYYRFGRVADEHLSVFKDILASRQ